MRKNIKKLVCLSVSMAFGIINGSAGWQKEGNTIKVQATEADENGFVIENGILKDYNGDGGDIVIPSGVVEIGKGAFYDCSEITSVKMPESLLRIGSSAFEWCDNLVEIEIPFGVINIGESAFQFCNSIEAIHVSENNNKYSSENGVLFDKKKETLLKYPSGKKDDKYIVKNGVLNIAPDAFYDADFSVIVISSSVTNIGNFAFENCYNLTDILVSDESDSYSSVNGVLYDKEQKKVVKYPSGRKEETYTILDSVTTIGNDAFESYSLKEVIIPEGVTKIEKYAFESSSLINIQLPSSLKEIGEGAFYYSELNQIKIPDGVERIEEKTFENCKNLKSVELPSNLKVIRAFAFEECRDLKEIIIPDGVSKIEECTFSSCYDLKNVKLPFSLTKIGKEAFSGCRNLIKIEIPSGVTYIGDYAFSSCSNLVGIAIPDSVVHIEDESVFEDAKSSFKIFCHNNSYAQSYAKDYGYSYYVAEGDLAAAMEENISIEDNEDTKNTKFVIDGNGELTEYIGKEQNIVIPSEVKSIGSAAFSYKNVVSIEIPEGVTQIGDFAFEECEYLERIKFPDSMVEIGEDAFYNCALLQEINIPDSITKIGAGAFTGCSSLQNIQIPKNITIIEDYTFSRCESLNEIEISDKITRIGKGAFASCKGLTSIVIPENVTQIGNGAFHSCTHINDFKVSDKNNYYTVEDNILFNKDKTILLQYMAGKTEEFYAIPDTIEKVAEYAFSGCVNLKKIDISDKKIGLDRLAFDGCDSLEEINFPTGTEWIGTFENCGSLKNFIIPDGVKQIFDGTFNECKKLENLVIPDSVEKIEDYPAKNYGTFFNVAGNFKIYCHEDSYAHQYAEKNNYQYVLVEGDLNEALQSALKEESKYIIDENGILIGYTGEEEVIKIPSALKIKGIAKAAFSGNSRCKNIQIPEGVDEIQSYAFENCTELEMVTLPESLLTIGDYAFYNCIKLIGIKIPKNVISIENDVFGNCSNLKEINVDGDNQEYCSVGGILLNKKQTKLKQLPAGKTTIGEDTFKECIGLESMEIPIGITDIGNRAFFGFTNLTAIAIPDNVTVYDSKDVFSGTSADFIIYCHENSTAYTYAKKYGYQVFVVNTDADVGETMRKALKKEQVTIGDADGNGQINSGDALTILKIAAKVLTPSEEQEKSADVNGDGRIDAGDALKVLKYAAKLITEF